MIVERIQMLCKERGITLAQLQKEVGFGNGSIRRWDDHSPSIDKVKKIANYFEVNLNDLIIQEGGENY